MADPAPLLSLVDLSVRFSERDILRGVSLTINEGDRLGLLGVNGSGKSTLLRVAAGRIAPDGGEARPRRGLRAAYFAQELELDESRTVRQWIEGALAGIHAMEHELHGVHDALSGASGADLERLMARQSDLQHRLEEAGAFDAHARVDAMIAAVGLAGRADCLLSTLSGGEKRRADLARVLLEDADLVILDEPTNHLDAQTLEWLEGFLQSSRASFLFVTHDRYFLDRVATRLVELAFGGTTEYQGGYEDYLEAKAAALEIAQRADDNRRRALRSELEWLRRQPKARTTKSKSRIAAAADMAAQAGPQLHGEAAFQFPDAPRIGKRALETRHLRVERGGRVLVDGLNFTMGPRDRVALVGLNGSGKTSLLRVLLGVDRPAAGEVEPGRNVEVLYADQERKALDLDKPVLEVVAGDADWVRVGGERISIRAFLRRFLIDDEIMARPVGLLSGGERSRVLLARLIRAGGNLVALDEPTNDLDLHTLRVLEDALLAFDGAALVVSHDRYFLQRIATRILWLEGDGTVHEVFGAYEDYRAYRDRVLAGRAASAKAEAASAPAPVPAAKRNGATPRKLTFNEQREFDGMEQRILAAEEEFESISAKLEDPATYAAEDGGAIRALVARKDDLEADIARLYERWAELGERAR